jgi:hypothetical protein
MRRAETHTEELGSRVSRIFSGIRKKCAKAQQPLSVTQSIVFRSLFTSLICSSPLHVIAPREPSARGWLPCLCMAVTVGHVARLALTTDAFLYGAHSRRVALALHACARHASVCAPCLW